MQKEITFSSLIVKLHWGWHPRWDRLVLSSKKAFKYRKCGKSKSMQKRKHVDHILTFHLSLFLLDIPDLWCWAQPQHQWQQCLDRTRRKKQQGQNGNWQSRCSTWKNRHSLIIYFIPWAHEVYVFHTLYLVITKSTKIQSQIKFSRLTIRIKTPRPRTAENISSTFLKQDVQK